MTDDLPEAKAVARMIGDTRAFALHLFSATAGLLVKAELCTEQEVAAELEAQIEGANPEVAEALRAFTGPWRRAGRADLRVVE